MHCANINLFCALNSFRNGHKMAKSYTTSAPLKNMQTIKHKNLVFFFFAHFYSLLMCAGIYFFYALWFLENWKIYSCMNKVKALKFICLQNIYSTTTTTNITINEHIKIRLLEHIFIAFSWIIVCFLHHPHKSSPTPKTNLQLY